MTRGECPPHSPWVGVPFRPLLRSFGYLLKTSLPDGISDQKRLSSEIWSTFLAPIALRAASCGDCHREADHRHHPAQ